MNFIERKLGHIILQRAETRPAVLVTGIRQAGKSTLLRHLFPTASYVTFDHIRKATSAFENPKGFLDSLGTGTVIIDEIQHVPTLFRELKIRIDEDRQAGRWILTGSQKFALLESARESLAGRVAILELQTLGAEELRAFATDVQLEDLIWKGGLPELWANPSIDHSAFLDDYVTTYLEKDLRSILASPRLTDFHRLLRACALRVGSLLNFSDIARDIGISPNTAKDWVHGLEQSGVLVLVEPWFENLSKRLTKTPKLYFTDQGLLCHLLNIHEASQWIQHSFAESIWENFVFNELIRNQSFNIHPGHNLFFYRDHSQNEVDFVLETAEELICIEAKLVEQPNLSRLNIHKLRALLPHRKIRAYIACRIPDAGIFSSQGYELFNPLFTDPFSKVDL